VDGWTVTFVFVVLGAAIIVLVVALSRRGTARLELPGRAGLSIEFDKGGWQPDRAAPPQSAAPLSPTPRAWLVAGARRQWKLVLDNRPQITIGRREDNDIWLKHDRAAESRHAVITWDAGRNRYRVTNLSTTNPVRVNNRPISWQYLGDGNTITVGQTKLIFHAAPPARSQP
jgi:hypothetical protein